MAKDDKRSEHLLSDDAIPRVAVPKTESARMREFRLPSVVGKAARDSLTTGETATVPEPAAAPTAPDKPAAADDKPAGKRRRSRPSTGRFKDRTLNWFKTGDAIDGEEPLEGDYEPMSQRNWLHIGAAVAGVVALALIAIWLIS